MSKEPIVKYAGQFWVLTRISENEMAVLYRNGVAAIVPISLIKEVQFM